MRQYQEYGYLKPGIQFYKLLSRAQGLEVPIPDTFVVEDLSVRHVYNDEHGCICVQKMNIDKSKVEKEAFIARGLTRCIHNSVPIVPPTDENDDKVYNRMIAVYKQQSWRTNICNKTEPLSPLGLQARLIDAVYGSEGSCVLQKFIRCRGRTPSLYRIFYKKTAEDSFDRGNIVGWNISCVKSFKQPTEMVHTILDVRKRDQTSAAYMNLDEINPYKLSRLPISQFSKKESDLVTEMMSYMDLAENDRANVKLSELQNCKSSVYRNICSLTNEVGR